MCLLVVLLAATTVFGVQLGRGLVQIVMVREWWRWVVTPWQPCTITGCVRERAYDLGEGYDKVCREHL